MTPTQTASKPQASPTPKISGNPPENSPVALSPEDTPRDHRIPLGRTGEDAALTWLLARGYTLIERNYRFGRHGELDLIMEAPEGDIAFVEVKTSRSSTAGDPLGWIHGRKQHKVQRIAQAWCLQRGINMNRPMRFDAVAVHTGPDGTEHVVHVPNAFLPDGKGYWRSG
jgi:putative endonuclease